MSWLRELREVTGETQYGFSRLCGIERNRLSLAECAHVNLSAEEILKVKNAVLLAIERRTQQFQAVLQELEPSKPEVSV